MSPPIRDLIGPRHEVKLELHLHLRVSEPRSKVACDMINTGPHMFWFAVSQMSWFCSLT